MRNALPERREPQGARRWPWFVAAGGVLLAAWLAFEYERLPDPSFLRTQNPERTALMEQREQEAREKGRRFRKKQYWVRLSQLPKYVPDAVLLSEDAAFFQHDGVDQAELKNALVDAWEKGKLGRGASTITMQLAKNLWLSTDRSLVRKLKELVLTARLEEALSKPRILTLYLNVAEWGDGVYGVEAGAREHFGVSASALSPAQAAVLAVMLPAPRTWSPAKKSRQLHRRSLRLIARMKATGRLSGVEAEGAKAEIERMFGGRAHGADVDDADLSDNAVPPSHLDADPEQHTDEPGGQVDTAPPHSAAPGEDAPAVEEAPIEEDAPAAEDAPALEEAPSSDEAPTADEAHLPDAVQE